MFLLLVHLLINTGYGFEVKTMEAAYGNSFLCVDRADTLKENIKKIPDIAIIDIDCVRESPTKI